MASELLLLTGIPSPGKARLRSALQDAGLSVSSAGSVRVHAETDLEALLEPELQRQTRAARKQAHIVIPVDWEPAFVTPQGKLKYDAPSMQAIVDVTGPTRASTFSERIDVSTLVRAAAE